MANITGMIKSVLGEVTVTRADGEQVALKEGDIIAAGDTITTGPEGSAYIEFPAADGKNATEGILQANSKATLKATDAGAQFEVAEGDFEVTSEDTNNPVVAVAGTGGMMGLFGASMLAGGLAGPLAAAAGAAFVIAGNNDNGDGGSSGNGGGNGVGVPDPVQTVASTTGPLNPTVTGVYTGVLDPVATPAESTVQALAPVTDALEPVTTELAPVTDALSPILDPVNTVGTDALAGLAPATTALDQGLSPVTDALTNALSPLTDALTGSSSSMVAAAAAGLPDLPVNLSVIAQQLGGGLEMITPTLGDGLGQAVAALDPALSPLHDGLVQLASAAQPLFDGLGQVTDALPMVSEPVGGGIDQLFAALEPVTSPLIDALNGGVGGGAGGLPSFPTTGTPLDQLTALLDPSSLPSLPAGGASEGPTGTPLDAVLGPVADALGGGAAGLPSFPSTGTPLDDVTALLNPANLPISTDANPLNALTSQLPTGGLPV